MKFSVFALLLAVPLAFGATSRVVQAQDQPATSRVRLRSTFHNPDGTLSVKFVFVNFPQTIVTLKVAANRQSLQTDISTGARNNETWDIIEEDGFITGGGKVDNQGGGTGGSG